MFVFWLLPSVLSTISQHWFTFCLGAKYATSHYLSQWCSSLLAYEDFVARSSSLSPNSTHVDTASRWETWIRIWTTFLFLDANTASMLDVGVMSTWFVCNPWWESWDVAIIYTQETRICVTVQWTILDHMTLSPAKLNLIGTAVVNSHVMTGEFQTQSWSNASIQFFTIRTSTIEIWCLCFNSPGVAT